MEKKLERIAVSAYKFIFREEPSAGVSAFIRNLTFVGMGFGVSAVFGLVTQVLAGKILGPLEYGKYTIIEAVASFLCLPMLAGVNISLIKYSAEESDARYKSKTISTAYIIFLFCLVASSTLLFFFSPIISSLIGISHELFMYAIIFSVFYSLYLVSISVAQGLKEMKTISLLQIVYGVVGILVFLFSILSGVRSFEAILFASLASYLLVFVASFLVFRKSLHFDFDKVLARKIIRYGIFASLGVVAAVVCSNFDRIIINRFLGPAEVGVYGAYYIAFISSAIYLFNIFNLLFFPMVSGAKDKEAVFKKINKMLYRSWIFIFLTVFLMGVIVLKMYGGKYQFNIWLCLLFVVASLFYLITSMYGWWVSAIGENGVKVFLTSAVTAAVVSVCVNLSLTPRMGFWGAVLAIILSGFFASSVIVFGKDIIGHGKEKSFKAPEDIYVEKYYGLNIEERHLGGYVFSDGSRQHGDDFSYSIRLWSWLIGNLDIKSILDIGCGEGHATKYFSELGCDVLGIDGSKNAIKNGVIPDRMAIHDFTGGAYIPSKKYDAIWCCEFVEHVEEKYKDSFLETFKFAGKYIFMTHAVPGQVGWHHVNCQQKEYWISELDKIGFRFNPKLTFFARHIAEVGYFRKSGLVFINKNYTPEEFHYAFKLSDILFDIKCSTFLFWDNQIRKIISVTKEFDPKLYCFLKRVRAKLKFSRK